MRRLSRRWCLPTCWVNDNLPHDRRRNCQMESYAMGRREMSLDEFCRLVEQVLDELPQVFRNHLENVVVDVEMQPSARVRRELDISPDEPLLGLFQGAPLTEQEYGEFHPNRIVLYKRSIEAVCRSRREVAYEIRRTVMHELAHHFGFSEEDLDFYEAMPSPFDSPEDS